MIVCLCFTHEWYSAEFEGASKQKKKNYLEDLWVSPEKSFTYRAKTNSHIKKLTIMYSSSH